MRPNKVTRHKSSVKRMFGYAVIKIKFDRIDFELKKIGLYLYNIIKLILMFG